MTCGRCPLKPCSWFHIDGLTDNALFVILFNQSELEFSCDRIYYLGSQQGQTKNITETAVFFKGAQAEGQTWDLLVFVYFLSLTQRLRPLGYCAPCNTKS